jgi:hypothetical protein
MKNKSVLYYVLLFVAIVLFSVGEFILKAPELNAISQICIWLGVALLGMSSGGIIEFIIQDKNPSYKRQMNIEAKDERNISIKSKAKAKAFDVMGMVLGILLLIYVSIEADRLIIFLLLAAYFLVYAIYIVYVIKYSKEM